MREVYRKAAVELLGRKERSFKLNEYSMIRTLRKWPREIKSIVGRSSVLEYQDQCSTRGWMIAV
jgi:hypothetical protein